MGYREVSMLELKEVLLQWLDGVAKKKIARQVGVDVKTVRSYVAAAEAAGIDVTAGRGALTEERLAAITAGMSALTGRPRGDAWKLCVEHRERISALLRQDLRLTKARKLLVRQGIRVPYATLHRFAVAELGFGDTAPSKHPRRGLRAWRRAAARYRVDDAAGTGPLR